MVRGWLVKGRVPAPSTDRPAAPWVSVNDRPGPLGNGLMSRSARRMRPSAPGARWDGKRAGGTRRSLGSRGTVNPELAAAEQREREAYAAYKAAETASRVASAAWQEAGEEALRLTKRARPVRDLVMHCIKDFSPPPTAKWIINYTRHDAAEVKACLAELVAEGAVRCERGRYHMGTQP